MSDGIITGHYPPKTELGYAIIKQIRIRYQAKFTQHLKYSMISTLQNCEIK